VLAGRPLRGGSRADIRTAYSEQASNNANAMAKGTERQSRRTAGWLVSSVSRDSRVRAINLPGALQTRVPELAKVSRDTTGTPLAAFLYISRWYCSHKN
jgi:hypothetical protein